MSAPFNKFAGTLEDCIIELMRLPELALPPNALDNLTSGKSENRDKCPRIVVSLEDGEEAVYQSGIYRGTLKIRCITDIDSGDRAAAEALFGAVCDFIQLPDLKARLNATGKVFIHGFGLPEYSRSEAGDRDWTDTISLNVFGFATS